MTTTLTGFLRQTRPETASGTRYRADIDGLRAVAILPVLFYHFGVPPFSGGYVGVDVFFVISGYLITSLVHTEMEERRFSVIDFYERRIRRIFPALFAMIAVTTVAGLVALFPDALVRFAKNLPATAAFASNFQFVHKTGYFDVESGQNPLLHTWSLAVEEQFYLFFPGLLYLFKDAKRDRLLWILGLILAASFALNVWGVRHSPVSTFYLLPFRFWELLTGGLLAVGRFPAPENPLLRNAISLLGLALILIAIFGFSAATPYPGENALVPCIGTACILYAGSRRDTFVSEMLATPAPVAIGLISYSLYLVHWPIYVIAKAYALGPIGPAETVFLLALSFALAILSWRFVERPFRGHSGILSRRMLFAAAATAMLVTAAVGEILVIGKGLPQRFDPHIRAILAEVDDQESRLNECLDLPEKAVAAGHVCEIGSRTSVPEFLLWGDSHADAMLPAIDEAAASKNKTGLFVAHSACAPLLHVDRKDTRYCAAFNDAALRIALRPSIKLVILDGRWATYTDPVPYGPDDHPVVLRDAGKTAGDTSSAFATGLTQTVRALVAAGKRVVIVASVPETLHLVPQTLARAALAGRHVDIAPTTAEFAKRQRAAMALLHGLQEKYHVEIVYPDRILCAGGKCTVERAGIPLYRDASHLSVYGARLLTPLFTPVLSEPVTSAK